jgi:phosphate transport system substrate-binding protein
MTGKSETKVLLLSLLVTLGLVGAGIGLLRGNLSSSESAPPSPKSNLQSNSQSSANLPSPAKGFSQVNNVPSGTFNYGGSTTWAPIRGTVDIEIQKVRPEFRLNYVQQSGVAPSSQSGLELLAQGEVAFSLASRLPSNEFVRTLEEQGIQIRLIPVATSFDAIAVHPALPLSNITIDQVVAITTGKVNNWREIGGPVLLCSFTD